jgi:GNAT superfamily N-acetyltransferase
VGAWHEEIVLRDGRTIWVRPIAPNDAEPLRGAFSLLAPEDVRLRFLHALTEMTPEMAHTLTHLDAHRDFALVAAEPLPPGEALILAVARASLRDGDAEFAVIVGKPLRGQGLGKHLLRRVADWCRRRGARTLYGDVLIENSAMLELVQHLGFQRVHVQGEPGVVRVRLPLR